MAHTIVFLFAGQGSQYYGMGRELYEGHAGFRRWMERGLAIAEPLLGLSLAQLIYEPRPDRFEPFDRTLYTHPAIFLINFSLAKALEEEGVVPACLLGYSLGEAAAWAVAGALRLEEGLAFVIRSARLIEQRTPPAGMLAVLGPRALAEEHRELFAGTTVAAVNYDRHFVIAGLEPDLLRVQAGLKTRDVLCQRLPIQRGFHSPLLDPIAQSFTSLAAQFTWGTPRLPVVSCLSGRRVAPSELTPEYWWRVLRQPAYFAKAILALEEEGPHLYVEVGPSGTLAGFIKYLPGKHPASRALPVLTPFGRDLAGLSQLQAELKA